MVGAVVGHALEATLVTIRLNTVAPDLVELVDRADDKTLRRVAILAAEFAVRRASLEDPRADGALQAVREGRIGNVPERAAVEALAEALDDRQFRVRESIGSENPSSEEHLEAFGRARAASSVFHSGDADARIAALEALYEAGAVVDDLDDLRATVLPALS